MVITLRWGTPALVVLVAVLFPMAQAHSFVGPVLRGTVTDAGTVVLSWTPSQRDVTNYTLTRDDGEGHVATYVFNGNIHRFVDQDVRPGIHTYQLRENGVRGQRESAPAKVPVYPYCYPTIYQAPPWVSWSSDCYCPLPYPVPIPSPKPPC